jgi:hypothetical protein
MGYGQVLLRCAVGKMARTSPLQVEVTWAARGRFKRPRVVKATRHLSVKANARLVDWIAISAGLETRTIEYRLMAVNSNNLYTWHRRRRKADGLSRASASRRLRLNGRSRSLPPEDCLFQRHSPRITRPATYSFRLRTKPAASSAEISGSHRLRRRAAPPDNGSTGSIRS